MEKLRSIASIKKNHDYMMPEEMKTIDGVLEIIMRNPSDIVLKESVAEIMNKDIYTSIKESMSFQKIFPLAYHVQTERELVDSLIMIASKQDYLGEFQDIDENVKIRLEVEWETNPKITVVSIDGVEKKLMFQDSFTLLRSYLESSEHEFYKQALLSNLEPITDQYRIEIGMPLLENEEKRPKGYIDAKNLNYRNQYGKKQSEFDRIYYCRAKDYLIEPVIIKKILNGNEMTRDYALLFKDLKEGILKPTE